jgi:hypothetical protein
VEHISAPEHFLATSDVLLRLRLESEKLEAIEAKASRAVFDQADGVKVAWIEVVQMQVKRRKSIAAFVYLTDEGRERVRIPWTLS